MSSRNEQRQLKHRFILVVGFLVGSLIVKLTDHSTYEQAYVLSKEGFLHHFEGEANLSSSAASTQPVDKKPGEEPANVVDPVPETSSWPLKEPGSELFGDSFNECKVVFRDGDMSLCYPAENHISLGADVVQRILEYYFGCSAANLPRFQLGGQRKDTTRCLHVGGLAWREVRREDHVWGLGSRGKKSDFQSSACRGYGKFQNVTVYGIRGPKTMEIIEAHCESKIQTYGVEGYTKNLSDISLGIDAAMLVPFVMPELAANKAPERIESCVVHEDDDGTIEASAKEHSFVSLQKEWKSLAQDIVKCKSVSSASLTGYILADVYGIPTQWIRAEKNPVLKFEFLDYLAFWKSTKSSLGLEEVTGTAPSSMTLPPPISTEARSDHAKEMLESFPFHLFQSRPNKEDTRR